MKYIERLAEILKRVSRAKTGVGVSELASDLGIPKSGVYRIMSDLESVGFLSSGKDALRIPGESLIEISYSVLGSINFLALAKEELKKLSSLTNETVTFSRLIDNKREYLFQIESEQLVRMSVPLGILLPLHSGASGQALLSGLNKAQFEKYLMNATLNPVTLNTITDPELLKDRIDHVRSVGYSYSQGERDPLASSIATPVMKNGHLIGAISICGPLPRLDHAKAITYLSHLKSTAESIASF